MKNKIIVAGILTSILGFSIGVGAYAASASIKLIVNGKLSSVETKLINGTTYIPIRAAATLLDVDVKYDASSRTVTLSSAGTLQNLQSFKVDASLDNGPMKLNVSKVTFDPAYKEFSLSPETIAAIILDVTVENTSDDKLIWYVDESQLVLNTKEQTEDTLYSKQRISDQFNGKVVKKGKIVFPVTSKFDDITSFRLLTKYVNDPNYNKIADNKEMTIVLR
ncbi:stalk domain-containing protein [Paenibacillus sp. R14(2021)]|uniref:stalk domain-containing protein n=1 Tax=Paenibacillus sp. R14(2021) TaxID=2859228 RepID=UPI001C614B09|nr:stalk domain-containing protein [Paenibacillus sp. R14(2021)]